MGNREIDAQKRRITDLVRIVDDANRLGMPGRLGAHHVVARRFGIAPGISRGYELDALQVTEHHLHAPKAAAGKYGHGTRRRHFHIGRRGRNENGPLGCKRRDQGRARQHRCAGNRGARQEATDHENSPVETASGTPITVNPIRNARR